MHCPLQASHHRLEPPPSAPPRQLWTLDPIDYAASSPKAQPWRPSSPSAPPGSPARLTPSPTRRPSRAPAPVAPSPRTQSTPHSKSTAQRPQSAQSRPEQSVRWQRPASAGAPSNSKRGACAGLAGWSTGGGSGTREHHIQMVYITVVGLTLEAWSLGEMSTPIWTQTFLYLQTRWVPLAALRPFTRHASTRASLSAQDHQVSDA